MSKSKRRRRPAQATSRTVGLPSPTTMTSESSATSEKSSKRERHWRLPLMLGALAILVVVGVAWGLPSYWMLQAERAIESGRFDDAAWYFERADQWQWRSAKASLGQARVARFTGEPARARALLSLADSRGATPQQTALERKLLTIQGGGGPAIVDELPRMLVEMPEHGGEILEAFSRGFESVGMPDQAKVYVDSWIDAAPGDARALLHKAELLATLGEMEEAELYFHRALERDPTIARARHGLARLSLELNKNEQALALYDEIIAADPGDLDSRLLRCSCLFDLRRTDEAIEGLRAVLEIDEFNFAARHSLASNFAEQGKHDQVIELIGPLMKDFPHDVSLNYLLATAHTELGNVALADEHMQRHLDGRAQLDELGRLKKRLRQHQTDGRAMLELATGYLKYQWDESETWLVKAINALPNSPQAYRAMAEFQSKKGDVRRAKEYAKAAEIVSR